MTQQSLYERIRTRMQTRASSYRALFVRPGGAELTQAAEVVMRDLARYCYAGKSTLKVSHVTQQSDPIATAFAEGRRDVWLRITAMCNLTDEQIARIATSRSNDD